MATAAGLPPRSQDVPDRGVPECPYVGLVPFDKEDAAYFFGRERESDLIVANLTASRLTLLYAASGVGKTSVLRAGVLPRLHRIDDDSYEDLGIRSAAVVYVNSWRDDPLESIAAAVVGATSLVTGVGAGDKAASTATLSVSWLREVLRQSTVSAIYVILDQFEDYFLYHPTDRGEEGLTPELGRILSTRDLPVNVLLSIREDALASLDRFEGRVPHLFDNYLRLAHLSRDAARTAIEGPLDRYNHVVSPDHTMSIERGLIDALLDQVRTGQVHVAPGGTASDRFASDGAASDDREDIETPCLQLVLTRLWNQERATGSSSLRQSTLDDLGGAQTIVRTHLKEVMAGLSPAQVDVAAAVFHHLITPSGTKIALSAEDLAELTGLPVNAVRDLLDTLCFGSQRILRPVLPVIGIAGPTRYEIFHDVMGDPVLDWRRRYVTQTARRRLHQRLAVGLTAILLVVGALVIVTYKSQRNAQERTDLAEAAAILSYNPVESLKHAVDAYKINDNEQTRSAVLTAASSPRSQVVAGPAESKPMTVIGMASTPDSRHIVVYDTHGNIRVIGENGAVEHEHTVPDLRDTITPVASTISTPAVSTAAVAPDASRVALTTNQGTVAVINTGTGRYFEIDSKEDSTPIVVRWIGSAASGLILVVSKSGVAATYSPETGDQIARFNDSVYDALPLADEQHIVTSSEKDGRLRVWDARTGTKVAESSILNVQVLRCYAQSVVSLSLSANPSIVVWNWQAGPNVVVRHPVDNLDGVRQLIVNEHAQIVITSQDKKVRTFSLVDGSMPVQPIQLPPQAGLVNNVAISSDGQWITTAGADGRVLVWSLTHGQPPTGPTYEFFGYRGEVTQVSYLRAGTVTVVMSLGVDGTVRRWELPPVPRFEGDDSWVVQMDLSRDGHWLATAGQDGHAFIIDPHDLTKPPVATVSVNTPLRAVRFDPTEPHRILTLERSDIAPTLWAWSGDGKTKRLQKYESAPVPRYGYLVSIAISPDGKTVVGGDTGGTIHLWDAMTGKLRGKFPGTGHPAYSVAFDPTGQLLAVTDGSGVRFWRWGTIGPPTYTLLPDATSVTSVTFDPSGKHLLAGTAGDGTVKIWTTRDSKPDEMLAHGYLSSSLSFSNDGGLLAVGTSEGLVEVWDVHSKSKVAVMLDRHHSASVNDVKFLPGDHSTLISASDDTTVAQFPCPACTDQDKVIREAERWAPSG